MDWIAERQNSTLNLDLGTKCPLECSKCMRKNYKGSLSGHDCTLEEYDKLTDFFKRIGFCGQVSDPTAHPDFLKILEKSKEKGIFELVHTAASHRSIDWYKRAFEICSTFTKPCIWIFGLDGLPEDSHKYRKNQDGKKIWEVMKLGKEMGISINWQWIVFEYNWKDIKQGLSMAKKHKINFVPVLSQRWNKNDPLKPIPEVINCDNIDEIINLIDLWNCE